MGMTQEWIGEWGGGMREGGPVHGGGSGMREGGLVSGGWDEGRWTGEWGV